MHLLSVRNFSSVLFRFMYMVGFQIGCRHEKWFLNEIWVGTNNILLLTVDSPAHPIQSICLFITLDFLCRYSSSLCIQWRSSAGRGRPKAKRSEYIIKRLLHVIGILFQICSPALTHKLPISETDKNNFGDSWNVHLQQDRKGISVITH
jgi:hypothetical protein